MLAVLVLTAKVGLLEIPRGANHAHVDDGGKFIASIVKPVGEGFGGDDVLGNQFLDVLPLVTVAEPDADGDVMISLLEVRRNV